MSRVFITIFCDFYAGCFPPNLCAFYKDMYCNGFCTMKHFAHHDYEMRLVVLFHHSLYKFYRFSHDSHHHEPYIVLQEVGFFTSIALPQCPAQHAI